MRIGLVTGEYPPLKGGISNHVAVLAKYFTQHGHTTFIFSNNLTQQQQRDIPLTNTVSKWGYTANRLVNEWAIKNQLDIVNLHFQTAAYDMSPWVHFMPHMIDVPYVTTFHDLRFPYLFPKAGKLRDWIVMHLAKVSDGIIATNHEDYEHVKHLNAAMIPIGSSIGYVTDVDCKAIRQKLDFRNDDFILAHFGFINHSKGVDTLLHAIAQINDTHLKLLLIGGRTGTADKTNQSYADTIDVLIDNLSLTEQVHWTGFVTQEEVAMYLKAADLVVLPFKDGASFRRSSLMAAIEQACPIITTKPTVDIPEFSDGSVRLVSPVNVDKLAEAIQLLRDNPQQVISLREKIKELRNHFDWDVITQKNLEFFRHIIETRV
ncbi:MAG: glycosyltransferase family 4 protein [Chloroflexota bacterium]